VLPARKRDVLRIEGGAIAVRFRPRRVAGRQSGDARADRLVLARARRRRRGGRRCGRPGPRRALVARVPRPRPLDVLEPLEPRPPRRRVRGARAASGETPPRARRGGRDGVHHELLAEHAPTLDALDRLAGEDPFVLFFEPPSLDDRIVNQSAVLSAMSDPAVSMDGWLEENPGLWYAWRITPAGKAEIRARLDQGNVNERVLLPGLDGLAAWLRRYYAPASGDDALQDGARMGDPVAARGTGQGEED
jgi:hypothetical protein